MQLQDTIERLKKDMLDPQFHWQPDHADSRVSYSGRSRANVAVVGGSFAGLSAAYHLINNGFSGTISLVEKDRIGDAAARAAGILTPCTEEDLTDLAEQFGLRDGLLVWKAQREGIDSIEMAVSDAKMSCGFTRAPSYSFFNEGEAHTAIAEKNLRDASGSLTHVIEAPSYGKRVGYAAALMSDDALINPAMYCRELARRVEALGVRIYEQSPVRSVSPGRVELENGSIAADTVILAGQRVPYALGQGKFPLAVETACLATRPLSDAERLKSGVDSQCSFWGSGLPYYYGRTTEDGRVMIGGAAVFSLVAPIVRRRQEERLLRKLHEFFPTLTADDVEYMWHGKLHVVSDLLPVVGETVPGIHVIGNAPGIPFATISGKVVADAIQGKQSPYADVFRISKKSRARGKTNLKRDLKTGLSLLGF